MRGMPVLNTKPNTASATSRIPAFQTPASPSCAEATPAITPPPMIDTKVPSPMIPFPQLRRHPGSNSGSELYLAGLK